MSNKTPTVDWPRLVRPHRTRRRLFGLLAEHAASLAIAFVFLLPLVWMLAASLRQPGLPPPRTIEWLPHPLAWSNYLRIFEIVPLVRYALNSLMVAAAAVIVTLGTASWAGLGMALASPRWRGRWVALAVGLLLVPPGAVWLPRFVLFTWLHLTDTYSALLAPALMGSSPLFVLLFFWSYRRVSVEVFESARLDGAGPFAIWRWIALPLSTPTAVAVAVLTFWLYWSDFINPLLYIKSPSLYTLPIGVRQLQQLNRTNWPLLMAAAVVATVPAVLVFLAVQRYLLGDGRQSE
jgi:multiple sugar transport system permease protein